MANDEGEKFVGELSEMYDHLVKAVKLGYTQIVLVNPKTKEQKIIDLPYMPQKEPGLE